MAREPASPTPNGRSRQRRRPTRRPDPPGNRPLSVGLATMVSTPGRRRRDQGAPTVHPIGSLPWYNSGSEWWRECPITADAPRSSECHLRWRPSLVTIRPGPDVGARLRPPSPSTSEPWHHNCDMGHLGATGVAQSAAGSMAQAMTDSRAAENACHVRPPISTGGAGGPTRCRSAYPSTRAVIDTTSSSIERPARRR